jgi:hypothetical protein
MSRVPSYSCAACEQTFVAKWALDEHAKSCPVKRNAELARIHEALVWKHARIEASVGLCYRYAARGLVAHHSARPDEAHRFNEWFADEYQQSINGLEQLINGIREAGTVLFPRLERMKREVSSLFEQAKDLAAIGAVMNRLIAGGR